MYHRMLYSDIATGVGLSFDYAAVDERGADTPNVRQWHAHRCEVTEAPGKGHRNVPLALGLAAPLFRSTVPSTREQQRQTPIPPVNQGKTEPHACDQADKRKYLQAQSR